MTETRPTTLQLAEFLENLIADPMWPDHFELSKRLSVKVVEELRRLHEENERLRDRLAQPEPEPVAWIVDGEIKVRLDMAGKLYYSETNVYTAPVHAIDISQECVDETAKCEHEWVGLTDEEFSDLLYFDGLLNHVEVPLIADLIRAVQAKLKEKNHGNP